MTWTHKPHFKKTLPNINYGSPNNTLFVVIDVEIGAVIIEEIIVGELKQNKEKNSSVIYVEKAEIQVSDWPSSSYSLNPLHELDGGIWSDIVNLEYPDYSTESALIYGFQHSRLYEEIQEHTEVNFIYFKPIKYIEATTGDNMSLRITVDQAELFENCPNVTFAYKTEYLIL